MSPGSTQSAVSQRHQHSDGNHARMARLLLIRPRIDECAQPGVAVFVDEVDQVLRDHVRSRRQTLVLDGALKIEPSDSLLPNNCVPSLDVELNQEQRRYGRAVR